MLIKTYLLYMDVREKGNDNELDDLITDISRHNLTQPSKEPEKDSTPKVRRVSKKRKKNPPEEMPISPLPENNSVTTEALQYLQEASKKIRKLMKNLERNVTAQQYEEYMENTIGQIIESINEIDPPQE